MFIYNCKSNYHKRKTKNGETPHIPNYETKEYTVKSEDFACPIQAGTFMDMMYMPDALKAAIDIMNADPSRLIHRNAFNVASMSFDTEIIKAAIQKYIPDFKMHYEFDPVRQAIADSWPFCQSL